MPRWRNILSTIALLAVISLPTIVFVVVNCVGAAYVQQAVFTANHPNRRHR